MTFARPSLSLLLFATALLAGAGCAGSLLDPAAFESDAGGVPGDGTNANDAGTAAPAAACPDIPTLFAQTCGTAGCHDGTTKAEALDLASPNVASRLVGVLAVEANALLIDPNTPSNSAVYRKLLATPPFGARMPSATGLDDATIQCVLTWVTAVANAGAPSESDDGGATGTPDSGSVDAGPPFSPLRIAAGQTTAVTDSQGNSWAADTAFTGGTAAVQNPATSIAGTDTPALYNGQRYGDPSFGYQFTVPNGTYTVTLKFAEQYVTGPAMREFDIAINGTAVETNFDIYAVAGAMNTAVDESFVVVVTGGVIQLAFTPGTIQSPKVDAIQIVEGAVATDGGM
jgi:hypothetical protein